ncbi:ABC transporter ATP-binding protein [Lederbergia lenta]|uniref:ABC transporter-like protein n=1 Tax=Lederbergia lenta TaxID=1467 RepID=A0A2X4VNJ3_LEDLE|nr:ABC transporter ATP-binding protein [Lederbergia lenta]MCM3112536.1 ABC transporter ATP-binding protein/permease [Lederbergia lenta]MEC2323572.1 ABC transporter ATP-binding protein [Lederbergia lenta]SQI52583.1 ABC transporter-like protein [Lederbergia lenta]
MFSVLGKLGWFFKKHWKRYASALVLLGVANIFEVIPPFLLGAGIDHIHLGTMTKSTLLLYIGILVGISVFNYAVTYVWQYQLFGGAFIVEKLIRSRLMNHLLKMTPTFFEKNRTGDLMARGTNDLRAISTTAGFGILTLFDSTMYMLTILLTMGFLVSWKLTLAAILPLPILALIIKILGAKIHTRFMTAQDAFGDMNDSVLEAVAGVRVIRAYVQEKESESDFRKMTEDVYQKNIAVAKIDAFFNPITKVITGISYVIGLSYGTYLVFHQEISLGHLVSFNVYLGMLIWPMFAIGELINVMQRGNASLDRVQTILNYEEDVKDPEVPKQIEQPEKIAFSQTVFRYPSSHTDNLKDVSLEIGRGATIGVVGKTGSGKTTFIKQFLREYPLGQGDIMISDISIADQSKDQLRSWVGYVPQDHVLFSRSVRENILFGDEKATEADLKKAIHLAYFEKDLAMLPEGLETLVGEKGVALSGGQKQRISIARALIKNPELLILDDSLSAVDAKTESRIIRNIRKERQEKTTIITTHRLSAIEHADWIIVFDDGKVIEEGTHEQLIASKGWYKEQYDRQQVESLLEGEVQA